MTVIRNIQNYYNDDDRNKPDNFGYNLEDEKKRIAEATEEIKKELLAKWQKRYAGAQIFPSRLANANPNLINFLLSFNNTLFYNDLANKFGFNEQQRDMLPQIVWEIALSKNWDGAGILLGSKLKLNPEASNQILQLVNQNILSKAKELSESKIILEKRYFSGEQKEEVRNTNLSILQAIQQYSKLGEQLITSSPIKLKIFPQSVRPSIKNWIEDYRGAMGAQKHGMMERGNYLFHTENTKVLTSGDRKKLAEVLRSLDEEVALKVDPDRQEIVFQQEESRSSVRQEDKVPNSQIQNRPLPNPLPKGEGVSPQNPVRFSSPQTMSGEKNDNRVTEPLAARPLNNNSNPMFNSQAGRPWIPSEEKKEPTVRGNVVDLKN